MTLKRALFNKCSDALIWMFGLNRPVRAYRAFLSRVNSVKRVRVNGTEIAFDANDELHLLRAELIERKEPETIAWIDTFGNGEVFYDIGANVGVFSLYAALHRGSEVFAFEPEAKNYACLNRNILLNGLGRQVKALNAGLFDATALEFLQLHDLASGSALHALGEPIDWRKNRFQPKFEQAVLAYRLDDLRAQFALPAPRHVKLDVDGNEMKIIEGGRRTFSDPALRSLMVEINENDRPLWALIESCGLRLDRKALVTMQGPQQDFYNAVFRRP